MFFEELLNQRARHVFKILIIVNKSTKKITKSKILYLQIFSIHEDYMRSDSDIESDLSGWERVRHSEETAASHLAVAESTNTLVADAEDSSATVTPVDGTDVSTSPLTAEAVAKSLLQKFAKKKHPLASELHWLVRKCFYKKDFLKDPIMKTVQPRLIMNRSLYRLSFKLETSRT